MAFWVLIGSLFIFQGPYFHYFGFIHVNCLIFAGIGSGLHCWQILIFTYAYALIFIHRRFGSLFWLLGVLIGSLFHKKWVLIGSLSQSLGVLISFGDSGSPKINVFFLDASPNADNSLIALISGAGCPGSGSAGVFMFWKFPEFVKCARRSRAHLTDSGNFQNIHIPVQ